MSKKEVIHNTLFIMEASMKGIGKFNIRGMTPWATRNRSNI